MNIIDSILDFLEEEDIGTVGTDLFNGELPIDKNDVVSAVFSPSPDPDRAIPYFIQRIDFWARFSSFDDGYGKLQEIMDLLHQKRHYDIEGYHIYLSNAGMIQDNDRDAERRHLFSLSMTFTYRDQDRS